MMSNLAARPNPINALRGIRTVEGEDSAAPAAPASDEPKQTAPKPEAPKPAGPAQETDWKAEARKWEQRAKENSEAATRLKEIEDAQKTEAQRLQEERDQAKQALESERSARLRAEVAAEKGIPAALLTGSTKEELEASAEALIKFKGEQPKKTLHVPGEGKEPPVVDIDDQIREATKNRNFALVATLKQLKADQQKG